MFFHRYLLFLSICLLTLDVSSVQGSNVHSDRVIKSFEIEPEINATVFESGDIILTAENQSIKRSSFQSESKINFDSDVEVVNAVGGCIRLSVGKAIKKYSTSTVIKDVVYDPEAMVMFMLANDGSIYKRSLSLAHLSSTLEECPELDIKEGEKRRNAWYMSLYGGYLFIGYFNSNIVHRVIPQTYSLCETHQLSYILKEMKIINDDLCFMDENKQGMRITL